jgi:hypothetical protein
LKATGPTIAAYAWFFPPKWKRDLDVCFLADIKAFIFYGGIRDQRPEGQKHKKEKKWIPTAKT